MSFRKRLIIEAKNAYNNKSFKNGQILMAKAKIYKQEIDKIYKNQKFNNSCKIMIADTEEIMKLICMV